MGAPDQIKGGVQAEIERVALGAPSLIHTQSHLEAIDVQDGNGQRVLLWGYQSIDPGDEPAEQQSIQDLCNSIPGVERGVSEAQGALVWGGVCGLSGAAVASPSVHGALHSQRGEDLLSHRLLGKATGSQCQQHGPQRAPRG